MPFVEINKTNSFPLDNREVFFFDNEGHFYTGSYHKLDKMFAVVTTDYMCESKVVSWKYTDSLSRRNGVESDSLDNRETMQKKYNNLLQSYNMLETEVEYQNEQLITADKMIKLLREKTFEQKKKLDLAINQIDTRDSEIAKLQTKLKS